MGVKSTVTMTRSQAEERFVAYWRRHTDQTIAEIAAGLNDYDLENALEYMNDQLSYNGQGFDNYSIVPDDER
ncbi:hypothetical protein PHIN3_275 [Sinorhizobium phage phiN3]|uniref:Uncharacterized protein n=1 Tax=Sinorhizobium phage phiN3 TaxID=1647405 RepID=A0A0F6SJ40_9CAUD|nr:hypothetical protein AVT40_gp258 [Sinorhizobium phage phiN3]AKF13538.1 hypothetical protein PHIN3_275 [Sinorhizobium phage phiN3]